MTNTRPDTRPAKHTLDDQSLPGHGTLPGLVYAQSLRRPNGVALRKKDFGIWQADYLEGLLRGDPLGRPGAAPTGGPGG